MLQLEGTQRLLLYEFFGVAMHCKRSEIDGANLRATIELTAHKSGALAMKLCSLKKLSTSC